jgi:hypothetical protein
MSVVTRCPALAVYEIFVPLMVIVCCVIAAVSVVSVIESSFAGSIWGRVEERLI